MEEYIKRCEEQTKDFENWINNISIEEIITSSIEELECITSLDEIEL